MPFQPINFANITPQGNPGIRDFIDSLTSGYKSGQLPAQMERKTQEEELANALNKFKLEHAPEQFDLDRRSKEAQIASALSLANLHNRGGSGSSGGGIGNLTTGARTKMQEQLKNIKTVIPLIRELTEIDTPSGFSALNPNLRTRYNAKAGAAFDTYIKAKNFPSLEKAIQAGKDVIYKSPWETESNYRTRLAEELAGLEQLEKDLNSYLGIESEGSSSGSGDHSSDKSASKMTNEELIIAYGDR
jgi:hypothetical protein